MAYDPNQGAQYPPQQHGQQPPYGQPYGQPPPPVVSGPPAQPYGQQQWAPPAQPYPSTPPPPGGQQPWIPPQPGKPRSKLAIIGIIAAGLLGLCLFGAAINNFAGDDKAAVTVKPPAAAGTTAKKPAEDTADKKTENATGGDKTFDVPVGSTISATGNDGSVIEGTLRSVKTSKKGCVSLNVNPKNGMYVIVDVLVVQKKGSGSVNPLDFTFVTDDGTSNDALSGSFSGCGEPALQSTDLRAGQKRAGKIVFDVSSKAGSLEWAPGGLLADKVGSWKTK